MESATCSDAEPTVGVLVESTVGPLMESPIVSIVESRAGSMVDSTMCLHWSAQGFPHWVNNEHYCWFYMSPRWIVQ
eukprot:5516675-Lingulodinium_polyedra.AAC.1